MKKIKKFDRASLVSKYDLVVIEWEDISTEVGWNGEQETAAAKPCVCVSVGFLIEIRKTCVVLCSGFAQDDDVMDVTSYPKGTIKNIMYLTKKRSARKKVKI